MFKNKDGSYNKIQLTIISLIGIIGIDIILSSIFVNEDPMKLFSISLALISLILLPLAFISVRKSQIINTPPVTTDSIQLLNKPEVLTIERSNKPESIVTEKYIEPIKIKSPMKENKSSGVNMVSLIITLVIAAVAMIIGLVIISNLQAALPELPSTSITTSDMNDLQSTLGSAVNFLTLGLFTLAAVFIIGLVMGVLK